MTGMVRDPRGWTCATLADLSAAGLFHDAAGARDVARHCASRLVLVATPYAIQAVDPDGAFDASRSIEAGLRAARVARHLAVEGVTAVAPAALRADMVFADFMGQFDPLDAEFWARWEGPLHRACGAVVVPRVAAWDRCGAVWSAACAAWATNRPVFLISDQGGQFA